MGIKFTKTNLILLTIVFLAFILRLTAAANASMTADEEVYNVIPLNIINAGRLSTVEQSPLYFYLVDVGYKLFGVTSVTARLPQIIFGALATILIFLISQQIFKDKKVGLISAFLFAISGYSIRFNIEMDMVAFFFSLLSVLFFLKALEGKNRNLYLAALFLALGVAAKILVLAFVPAFAIIWIIHRTRHKKLNKNQITAVIIATLIALAVLTPIFSYNYLLYKDKGVSDYYFSNILGIGETVHGGLGGASWSFSRFFKGFQRKVGQLWEFDTALLILGLVGVFLGFNRDRYGASLLVLSVLFLYGYLLAITGSHSHYIWLLIVFSIFAGNILTKVSSLIKQRVKFKHVTTVIMAVVFVFNIFLIRDLITTKHSIPALRSYIHENVPDSAIVVVDPRIYRGIAAWTLSDKHYLEGTYFQQFNQALSQLQGPELQIPIYYIECGKATTCTWGDDDYWRVYNYSEQLTDIFKQQTQQVAKVSGRGGLKEGDRHEFIIYQGSINVPVSVYELVDRTQRFWFYPVGWKYTDNVVDNYTANGFGKVINTLGFTILYIDLIIALLAVPFTFVLLFKKEWFWSENE
jgi:hypothetical protein